jgi:hypothetical protein
MQDSSSGAGRLSRQGRRAKSRTGDLASLKDVKNEGRSGNVYENKGTTDDLPDTKDDISAWLDAILHGNTRILQKPSALLPLFERFGTNSLLQNAEPREAEQASSSIGSISGVRI